MDGRFAGASLGSERGRGFARRHPEFEAFRLNLSIKLGPVLVWFRHGCLWFGDQGLDAFWIHLRARTCRRHVVGETDHDVWVHLASPLLDRPGSLPSVPAGRLEGVERKSSNGEGNHLIGTTTPRNERPRDSWTKQQQSWEMQSNARCKLDVKRNARDEARDFP